MNEPIKLPESFRYNRLSTQNKLFIRHLFSRSGKAEHYCLAIKLGQPIKDLKEALQGLVSEFVPCTRNMVYRCTMLASKSPKSLTVLDWYISHPHLRLKKINGIWCYYQKPPISLEEYSLAIAILDSLK